MWYIIASSIIVVGGLVGLVIAIKLAMKNGKKLFPIILSMLLIAAISSLYFSINYYIEKKNTPVVWEAELNGHFDLVVLENGDTYSGDMVKGKMDGTGTLKYADGSIYTGEFSNSKRHGNGVYKDYTG